MISLICKFTHKITEFMFIKKNKIVVLQNTENIYGLVLYSSIQPSASWNTAPDRK